MCVQKILLSPHILAIIFCIITINLLTANGLAHWCAWSTTTCEKFMSTCQLLKHRVCACPQPVSSNGKQAKEQFCSSWYLMSWHRNGFTSLATEISNDLNSPVMQCMKRWLTSNPCTNLRNPDTPPWCGWSVWSTWSQTCGAAHRLRQRVCRCANDSQPISLCGGNYWETQRENRSPNCPASWCQWSVRPEPCTCQRYGNAVNKRVRECKCPSVPGKTCNGSSEDTCQKPSYCSSDITHEEPKKKGRISVTVLIFTCSGSSICVGIFIYCSFRIRIKRRAEEERRRRENERRQNETTAPRNQNEVTVQNTDAAPPPYEIVISNPVYPEPETENDAFPPSYDNFMKNQSDYHA